MKKLSAIFLLSIYLLSATPFSELLKVNVLVQHYQETIKKNGPVAFFDFLVMHYITDDGNTLDDDRDSELPFKSESSLVASNFSNFIINNYAEILVAPTATDKKDFHNYTDPYISSNFSKLFWNPPKIS